MGIAEAGRVFGENLNVLEIGLGGADTLEPGSGVKDIDAESQELPIGRGVALGVGVGEGLKIGDALGLGESGGERKAGQEGKD